jgi:DNA gyrase subunit B
VRLQKRGTIVTFILMKLFLLKQQIFSYDTLSARMRELSYLNKGITITFTDKRELDKDGNFVCEISF